MAFSALFLLCACLFSGLACLQSEGAQLFTGLGERQLTFPEETLPGSGFPHAALGRSQPALSILRPRALPGPEQSSHPLLYHPGLGKRLYFRMSQKYILCKVQKSAVFSFRKRLWDAGLTWVIRGQERSEGSSGVWVV